MAPKMAPRSRAEAPVAVARGTGATTLLSDEFKTGLSSAWTRTFVNAADHTRWAPTFFVEGNPLYGCAWSAGEYSTWVDWDVWLWDDQDY